jgi:hypothetical protein
MSKQAVAMAMSAIGSRNELQGRLKQMRARATHLCGRSIDGRPLSEAVAQALTELHDQNEELFKSPEKQRERSEYLSKAEKDAILQEELCALRIEQANNYLLADLNIVPFFFNIVNLQNDERPMIQNNTKQNIRVGYTGGDNGPKHLVKIVPVQEEILMNLRWLATEEVRVKKIDIYRGDVTDAANSTLMEAYDMKNQVEQIGWDLITKTPAQGGLFGAFTFGGAKKCSDVYVANPRIQAGVLPTTNDIVLAGNGANTTFRWEAFQAALDYEARWGQAFMDGPLRLTGRIMISGLDVTGIAKTIVPTGNTNNSVADELLEKGWSQVGYLGRNFTLMADNTIPPKSCYFEFNKKPATMWLKPGLAHEERRDDYETRKTNEEFRYMKQPIGGFINAPDRVRALRITFKN